MTDAELDRAYADAIERKDYAAADMYAAQIVDRLASPLSFIGGLFGAERFPLYSAQVNFSQASAARESTAKAAGDVASTFKFGFGGALLAAGLVAIAVIVYKVKK